MSSDILLISSWVNHPETLKHHRDLWVAAFPGETIRYIVYIDAKDYPDSSNFNDATLRSKLVEECKNNAIEYYLVPEKYHYMRDTVIPNCQVKSNGSPSARDVLVCHLAWNTHVLQNSATRRIGFIQPDIYPYKEFTWQSITRGVDFYYKPQRRENNGLCIDYAWNGLCFFTMDGWSNELKELVDFQDGFQMGVYTDSGGGLWKLLEALPESKKFGWTGQNSLQWSINDTIPLLPFWIMEHLRIDPRNKVDTDGTVWYYSEIQDERCFHLRAGCNWDNAGKEIHDTRYSNFIRLLREAIVDGTVFLK